MPPSTIVLVSLVTEDAVTKIVSFASLGIYLRSRWWFSPRCESSSGWRPSGKFTFGRLGFTVNVHALVDSVGGRW